MRADGQPVGRGVRGGMRRASGWLLAAVLGAAATAAAGQALPGPGRGPVVLELFTAQGCAACPPADRMLAELARRDDVIALALHVDYWDYIGWVDVFADPEHAERQKRYARANGLGTIYTPQVVIAGTRIMEGFRTAEIAEAIAAELAVPPEVSLSLALSPEGVLTVMGTVLEAPPVIASRATGLSLGAVTALAAPAPEPVHDVQLVRYRPRAEVEITGGENAGLTAEYVNIVTEWRTVGGWDLSGALELELPLEGEGPVVVLVQEPGQGAIVAAARLE